MLENIINKTKIGFVAATLCLGLYGCASTRINYPLVEKFDNSKFYQCDENNPNLYCDDQNVYPVVLVKFR